MSEFLKGNFAVKKKIDQKPEASDAKNGSLKSRLKEMAMANICGSMVYIDETDLEWDGDQERMAANPKKSE